MQDTKKKKRSKQQKSKTLKKTKNKKQKKKKKKNKTKQNKINFLNECLFRVSKKKKNCLYFLPSLTPSFSSVPDSITAYVTVLSISIMTFEHQN